MTRVVRAGADDLDQLSHLIAEAFIDLPPSQWLISDETARRQILPQYFRLYLEHALAHGMIQTTPERTAAALWLPIPGPPHPLPPGYLPRLTAVTWPWTDRFLSFDTTLDTHHPVGTPHRHLAILAVHPRCQGHGTGTALLNACHHELDHYGEPAYLEASSPRNRDLYLRHGYQPRPGAPFHLPEGGPPLWPMWREPQARKRPAHAVTSPNLTGTGPDQ